MNHQELLALVGRRRRQRLCWSETTTFMLRGR